MARHYSLPVGLAALALMAVAIGAPGAASASEPHRAYGKSTATQINVAPVRQRAVSTAVGIGGDALATASNQSLAQQQATRFGGPEPQINRSPSVQTAVSAAVSVGGNSAALASNNGPAALDTGGIGTTKPVSPLDLGRAPRTSTAVSTAVSIGGVPVR